MLLLPSNHYKGMPLLPSNYYKGLPLLPSNYYKGLPLLPSKIIRGCPSLPSNTARDCPFSLLTLQRTETKCLVLVVYGTNHAQPLGYPATAQSPSEWMKEPDIFTQPCTPPTQLVLMDWYLGPPRTVSWFCVFD